MLGTVPASPGDSPPRLHGPAAPRFWFIQALRAVACLTVVAIHYGQLFVAGHQAVAGVCLFPPLTNLPKPAYWGLLEALVRWQLYPATIAVFLFFLVSGFVIANSLERTGVGAFTVRRFLRLYPTLWAAQLLVLGALAWQADPGELA